MARRVRYLSMRRSVFSRLASVIRCGSLRLRIGIALKKLCLEFGFFFGSDLAAKLQLFLGRLGPWRKVRFGFGRWPGQIPFGLVQPVNEEAFGEAAFLALAPLPRTLKFPLNVDAFV